MAIPVSSTKLNIFENSAQKSAASDTSPSNVPMRGLHIVTENMQTLSLGGSENAQPSINVNPCRTIDGNFARVQISLRDEIFAENRITPSQTQKGLQNQDTTYNTSSNVVRSSMGGGVELEAIRGQQATRLSANLLSDAHMHVAGQLSLRTGVRTGSSILIEETPESPLSIISHADFSFSLNANQNLWSNLHIRPWSNWLFGVEANGGGNINARVSYYWLARQHSWRQHIATAALNVGHLAGQFLGGLVGYQTAAPGTGIAFGGMLGAAATASVLNRTHLAPDVTIRNSDDRTLNREAGFSFGSRYHFSHNPIQAGFFEANLSSGRATRVEVDPSRVKIEHVTPNEAQETQELSSIAALFFSKRQEPESRDDGRDSDEDEVSFGLEVMPSLRQRRRLNVNQTT